MRKFFLITLLLSCFCAVYSQQESQKKYYTDRYASKETTEEKGKYMEISNYVNDSIIQKEFIHVKTKMKIWTKSYLNDKPYGIWTFYDKKEQPEKELNYSFILRYGSFIPDGFLNNQYTNNSSLQLPTLNNTEYGLRNYIATNIIYPKDALDNGIQGKVLVQFTVDCSGRIDNISIVNGVCESIDRDAFRLIHSMSNMQPAKINGENVNIYMVIPINYLIEM